MKIHYWLFLFFVSVASWNVSAETLIYVHGWYGGYDYSFCNNAKKCDTWGDTVDGGWNGTEGGYGTLPGKTVRHVGWDTSKDWRYEGVDRMRFVLDQQCRANTCAVICHSTGCPITGRVLDLYGSSSGWRINRVLTLGSAEGGSELAEWGQAWNWFVYGDTYIFTLGGWLAKPKDEVIDWSIRKLTPSVVRNAYDHNDTAGVPFFHVAGYDGGNTGAAALLPGQDDGTVAFHSACGYSQEFSSTWCSNDYTWVWRRTWYGLKYVTRGVAQWTNHRRVEYCGRDGCDKRHMQLMMHQFQDLVSQPNP